MQLTRKSKMPGDCSSRLNITKTVAKSRMLGIFYSRLMMYDWLRKWVWMGGLHGLFCGFAPGAHCIGQCAVQGWGID